MLEPRAPTIVAVKFGFGDKTYDYLCPFPVAAGDHVIVATKRGEAKVEVVEVKAESDRATASVLRIAEPETTPEPAESEG